MRSRIVVAGRVVVAAMLLSGAVHAQAPLFRSLAYDVPPELSVFHVADFDSDGAADLAAVSGVHLNDGGGRFTTTPSGSATFPSGGAFADFDDDGDLDGFAFGGGSPAIFENDGGVFDAATSATFPAATVPPGVAFAEDYDGDGDDDLIFIGEQPPFPAPRPVTAWLRVGPFAFVAAAPTTLATTSSESISHVRDFDQDGDADVLVQIKLSQGNGGVILRIFRNDGGVFVQAASYLRGASLVVYPLIVGDFNGDGYLDFARQPYGWDELWVFYTGPSCAITNTTTVNLPGLRGMHQAIDYDQDGSDDLVASTLGGFLVLGGPSLTASIAVLPGGWFPGLADYDGDQDLDVLSSGRVYFGDAAGSFQSADHGLFPSKDLYSGPVALTDIDADGDLDLMRRVGAESRFHLNDGRAEFSNAAGPASWSMQHVVPFDWTGDGLPDLVGFDVIDLVIPTSAGPSFSPPLFYPVPGGRPGDVETADLDGNGATDLVLCFGGTDQPGGSIFQWPPQPTVFLFNGGGGNWSIPVTFSTNAAARNLAVIDYDGDGDLDVVQANHLAPATVLLRLPTTFVEVPHVPATTACSVVGGDFDQDGDEDLVFDGTLHLSNGAGGFVASGSAPTPAWPYATPEHFYFRTDAKDLNLDGLWDLLVEGGFFLGTGSGFGPYEPLPGGGPTFLPTHHDEPWLTGDLDGDGDLDAVDRYGTVFHNTTRQLVRGGRARPGYVASLEAFGPPSTEVVLAASFALAAAPPTIPTWGPVFLEIDAAFLLGSASTDATGRAVFEFAVDPSAPIGATVYFQAGMPTLGLLTGAAKLTVLGL